MLIEKTGQLVFGLPGNPVSTAVTFEEFVRPALRKLMGHRAVHRPTLRATITDRYKKKPGRLHFVRVTLERTAEGVLAHPISNQSSGVLTSLIRGQGLAVIPLESEGVEAGTVLDVQVLDTTFFDGVDRGF